ncbi:MAG: hypothetical protein ACKVS9_11915 [Phycisphaerae bacterium]
MNMKLILDFLKTHAISLASGALALGFIGAAVMGMSSTTVVDAMKKELTATGASSIQSLRSAPKNEAVIKAEKDRGLAFEKEYNATIDIAKQVNKREPLMAGVFPKPAADSTPFEFRIAYHSAIVKLAVELDATTPPTQAEIDEERQNIEEEYRVKNERDPDPAVAAAAQSVTTPTFGGGPRGGGRGGTGGGTGASTIPGLPDEDKYNPLIRARVAKARSTRMWYDPERSFHVTLAPDTPTAPTPDEMWYAQVSLWIQQDVVRGIKAINEEAAGKVTSGDANVQHMPVKRLIGVRVLGYELADKRVPFPPSLVEFGALSGESAPLSFTGRTSGDPFDVVRFEIGLIVDQRQLMRVVDSICKQNYFKNVGISFDQVVREKDEQAEGYLYGPDPVVYTRLSFECYMARDVFKEMQPEAVSTALSGAAPAAP